MMETGIVTGGNTLLYGDLNQEKNVIINNAAFQSATMCADIREKKTNDEMFKSRVFMESFWEKEQLGDIICLKE